MKKIFSRLKLRSIQTKDVTRYLVYAIAEILLIIIGILSALEFGNRNDEEKARTQERRILTDLKYEIQNNLEGLTHVIQEKNDIVGVCQLLLKVTGPNAKWSSNLKFDSLLVKTIVSGWKFKPENGVLNEILNSGKLEVIKNDSLRYAISSLPGYIMRFQFEDDMVINDLHTSYLPFISKYYPIKRTNTYKSGDLTSAERDHLVKVYDSKFRVNPEVLLTNLEFENQINIQMLWVNFSLFHYNRQKTKYEQITLMIDRQLGIK